MALDWDRLTDQDFEELCYDYLSKNGFENIEWYGRGGNDRGRDLKCTKSEIVFDDFRRTAVYLVQCKKWVSRPPEPSDLINTIAWADVHKPNALVIMVSNTLTGNSKDWLKEIEKSKTYAIFLYEEKNFAVFLEKNKDIYKKYFESSKPKLDDFSSDLQQRILLALAKNENLTVNEVSEEASISIGKVKSALKKLVEENYVVLQNKKYALEKTQAAFLKISEQVLVSNNSFNFIASPYANSFINPELVSYIESRFFLQLKPENKYSILMIIRISPSALHHALFGSNTLYKNGYEHLETLQLPKEEKAKWADSFPHQFILEILRKLLTDLPHPDSTDLLVKEKIDGYYMKIELRMANVAKPLMNVTSASGVMLHKAKGKIDAGELLSSTDPDLFIRNGDVLSNLGLTDKAIENYDLAISQVKDKEKLKAVYNNKGVTLMRTGNIPEAIKGFDEALKIDPNLKEAIKNKEECLQKLTK